MNALRLRLSESFNQMSFRKRCFCNVLAKTRSYNPIQHDLPFPFARSTPKHAFDEEAEDEDDEISPPWAGNHVAGDDGAGCMEGCGAVD